MAWGAAEIAAVVKKLEKDNDYDYISTKKEIEEAADDIPKKLKKENDDYSVDMDKFSQKVKSNEDVIFKDPKTGWVRIKNRGGVGHKGDKWKLYNRQEKGRRIASLTEDGKIVGK